MLTGARCIIDRRVIGRFGRGIAVALAAAIALQVPLTSAADAPIVPVLQSPLPAPVQLETAGLLPMGRKGQPYPPTVVVRGATSFTLMPPSTLPDGMSFTTDGMLAGTPKEARTFKLDLLFADSANPGRSIRGTYTLVILREATASSKPDPSKPPDPAKSAKVTDDGGMIKVFCLTQADLTELDGIQTSPPPGRDQPATASLADAAKPGDAGPALLLAAFPAGGGTAADAPGADQASVKKFNPKSPLNVLMDIEYPSQALFEAALSLATKDKALPADRRDAAIKAAEKSHTFDTAPPPNWIAKPDCDCVKPQPAGRPRVVYGMLPFWRFAPVAPPTLLGQLGLSWPFATPAGAIDFSQFDRVGFLGAQLVTDGTWLTPMNKAAVAGQSVITMSDWWAGEPADILAGNPGRPGVNTLAEVAHAHGTMLDLVLQRHDWSFLRAMQPDQIETVAKNAGVHAAVLADTPAAGPAAFVSRHLLWKFWHAPDMVFDGLTVMFDVPLDDLRDKYDLFFENFMTAVIQEREEHNRPFALNVVLPDVLVREMTKQGTRSTRAMQKLLAVKQMAERPGAVWQTAGEETLGYRGKTDITVRALVEMHEPAEFSAFDVGDAINRNPLKGASLRNELFSIVPLLFYPGKPASNGTAPPAAGGAGDEAGTGNIWFDQDKMQETVYYFNSKFAGTGVWPVPANKEGNGTPVQKMLSAVYADMTQWNVCDVWLRLAWQAALVATVLARVLSLLAGWPKFKESPVWARLVLIVPVTLATAGGLGLLYWDPALSAVRSGNVPLIVLTAVIALQAVLAWRKPTVKDP